MRNMIDFSNFQDTRPWYTPFLEFDIWPPLVAVAGVAAIAIAAYVKTARGLEPPASTNRPPANGNPYTNATYVRHLSSSSTLAYGLLAGLMTIAVGMLCSTVQLPDRHVLAAEKSFDQIEQATLSKYALEDLQSIDGDSVKTVDYISRGAPTGVRATLPDGSHAYYYLELTGKDVIELTNPDTYPYQVDPGEMLTAKVLKQKEALEDEIRASYRIADISPVTSADQNDAAAWLNTFGVEVPNSVYEVRVQFYDGNQAVMQAVPEGDAVTLVASTGVNPHDYVK